MAGCSECICDTCLRWWSLRCPHGGCRDDWRARHEPWPGPERRQWTVWSKPGEQAHWCRGGDFYPVDSCPEFVRYERDRASVQDCLEGVVVKYQDGYIQCAMVDVMGCEECYRRFEERMENEREEVKEKC